MATPRVAQPSRAEKRDRVRRLIAENPQASDREIGRMAGADGKTVAAVRNSAPVKLRTRSCGNCPQKFRTPKTPHLRKLEFPHPAENETPQLLALLAAFSDQAIAEALIALGRQSAVQLHLRRVRYRRLGSDANGRPLKRKAPRPKCSDEMRAAMKAMYFDQGLSTVAIAQKLGGGITRQNVYDCIRGR